MPLKEKATSRGGLIWATGISVLGIFVAVGAVMLARSDEGQIDVSAAIANINKERMERGEAPLAPSAAEIYQSMPNGGLVATDTPVPEQAPAPTDSSTTTATSTESTAQDESEEGTDSDIEDVDAPSDAALEEEPVEEGQI